LISGAPIAQVAFVGAMAARQRRRTGQDFQIDMLKIVSSAPPSFQLRHRRPVVQRFTHQCHQRAVVAGGTPINTGSIAFQIDGNSVYLAVSTVSGVTTITCPPCLCR